MIMLIGFLFLVELLGVKESKRKYRKKQYESDKVFSELYHGLGARPGEDFGTFKRRIKRLI